MERKIVLKQGILDTLLKAGAGSGMLRLMKQWELADSAVGWIEQNRK